MSRSPVTPAISLLVACSLVVGGLPACGGGGDDPSGGGGPTSPEALHASATTHAARVERATRDAVGGLQAAWDDLYFRGDVASFEAGWIQSGVRLELLRIELETLLADEQKLAANDPDVVKVATAGVGPQLEPLTTTLAVLSALSLIAWVKSTRDKVAEQAASKEAARKACYDKVYEECMELESSAVTCDTIAHQYCKEATYTAQYGAVMEGTQIVVTETVKEGAKRATSVMFPIGIAGATNIKYGDVKAVVEYADGVKDAWDTGTMIGATPQCRTQLGNNAPQRLTVTDGGAILMDFGGTCSLYLGTSEDGAFEDLPEGEWDLTLYTEGETRASVGKATIAGGSATPVTFKKKKLGSGESAVSAACKEAYDHLCSKAPAMSCQIDQMTNATDKVNSACGASAGKFIADATKACQAGEPCPSVDGGSPSLPAPCRHGPSKTFDYTGSLDVDGRTAQLTLTFTGRAVTGKLVGGPVCQQNMQLPKTDIDFQGALLGTWLEGGTISGTWTGGDYDCSGGVMVGYPKSGRVSLTSKDGKISLSRNVGGGHWGFSGGTVYEPVCP